MILSDTEGQENVYRRNRFATPAVGATLLAITVAWAIVAVLSGRYVFAAGFLLFGGLGMWSGWSADSESRHEESAISRWLFAWGALLLFVPLHALEMHLVGAAASAIGLFQMSIASKRSR